MVTDLVFVYKIRSLPEDFDASLFIESMMVKHFMVCCDIGSGSAYVLVEKPEDTRFVENAVLGIGLERAELSAPLSSAKCISAYAGEQSALANVCNVLSGISACIAFSFVTAEKRLVETAKKRIEHEISRKEVRLTNMRGFRGASQSTQAELYYDSGQRALLLSLLESLNSAMLANGTAYAVSIMLFGRDSEAVYSYLRSKLFIFDEKETSARSVDELFEKALFAEAMPLSLSAASRLFCLPDVQRIRVLKPAYYESSGDIVLGSLLFRGVKEKGLLRISAQSLNLGALVTGLPGTGKTRTAMGIAEQVLGLGKPVVVISPTGEWNSFAIAKGISAISLYNSKVQINFFKCDSSINIERFYENLSMLLASASNAGPYTRSLEKVLLAAFRRVYSKDRCPDPSDIYDAIEEEIIDEHAKRNNVGVEYTKHGENIRAALQNIRLLLSRQEFAYREGIDMGALLSKGAVFDLSLVSNSMKPFFYALILNQVYSFADSFDINGDSELRLLICVEEAQIALQNGEYTAAVEDLKQRIQDFRKKGIGLMLVAHSITDIDQSVRRLCQTKLYFRQSADVAKFAANDLVFANEDAAAVADMLKLLDHRVCAVNYINAQSKKAASSVLIKARELHEFSGASKAEADEDASTLQAPDKVADIRIELVDSSGAPIKARVELEYAGEKIFRGSTDSSGVLSFKGTLIGKRYKLTVLGERKKDARSFSVIGGMQNRISI
ncbi:MAG: hypothetical protein QXT43_00915 [Candidatus Micrarchaeaceae archaeon]